MSNAPIGFAFAAGAVAAFNPCGFALLPAYLTRFVGHSLRADADSVGTADALLAALRASVALAAGFVAVFGVAGLLIAQLSVTVQRYTPWLTVVVGAVLVVTGLLALSGRQWKPGLPLLQAGGGDQRFLSVALFGASYATVSLSCTIPAFLVAVSATFTRSGTLAGAQVFVSYALGMAAVLGALLALVAVFRHGVLRHIRPLTRIVGQIAAGLSVLAGAYVAYYGLVEVTDNNAATTSGPVGLVGELSAWSTRTIDGREPLIVTVAVAGVLLLAVLLGARHLRPTRR